MNSARHEPAGLPLGIGDGGEMTLRFLREEILTRFLDPELAQLEDGARIRPADTDLVLSTDSYVVDPPIFPGGDIGKLAICGTVNDLVASGARPQFASMGLMLTEGFPLEELRQILDSAAAVAAAAGLRMVAGDTKVLPTGVGPGVSLHVAGLGRPVHTDRSYGLRNARQGDAVLVSGSLGNHGLAVLSKREGLGFEQRVSSDCAPLHELILPILESCSGVRALRDPTRGGVAGVLHDLVDAVRADVRIDASALPVDASVRAGCEMLGLDPLDVINEGKMVLVVDPAHGDEVLGQLRSQELGRDAAIIGSVGECVARPHLTLRSATSEQILIRREVASIPRLC